MNRSLEDIYFLDTVKKMPLMHLPVRSVLVKVAEKSILISPGSNLTEQKFEEISPVTDIVGTSLFHCSGVLKSASVFPNAKCWGPIGSKTAKPKVSWFDEISSEVWPYQDELSVVLIEGMPKVNEVVFIHKKSKTLIVSDLFFNLLNTKGIGAWLILNMFGTYNKFGISSFFMKHVLDKELFFKSIEKMMSYDFENIIVSHGQAVFGNAKAVAQKAINQAKGMR